MTPSEKFCQSVACDILTRLFILWLLTEIRRDGNSNQQEQSANKRGPEENYDDSSEGKFEWKSIQLCWLFRETSLHKHFRDKSYHSQNLWKNVCRQSMFLSITLAKTDFFLFCFERTSFLRSYYIHTTSYGVESFYFFRKFFKNESCVT